MKNKRNIYKRITFEILFLLILISPFSFTKLYAQIPSLPESANFFDYLDFFYNSESYNAYDTTEGGEKSEHKRLKHIWGKRLHPHGDFLIANS